MSKVGFLLSWRHFGHEVQVVRLGDELLGEWSHVGVSEKCPLRYWPVEKGAQHQPIVDLLHQKVSREILKKFDLFIRDYIILKAPKLNVRRCFLNEGKMVLIPKKSGKFF